MTPADVLTITRALLAYRETCQREYWQCGSDGGAEYYENLLTEIDSLAERLHLPEFTALVDS